MNISRSEYQDTVHVIGYKPVSYYASIEADDASQFVVGKAVYWFAGKYRQQTERISFSNWRDIGDAQANSSIRKNLKRKVTADVRAALRS